MKNKNVFFKRMYYGWKHKKTLSNVIKLLSLLNDAIKSTPQENSKVTDS